MSFIDPLRKDVEKTITTISHVHSQVRSQAVNAKAKVDMSGWLILKGKRKYFGKLKRHGSFRISSEILLHIIIMPLGLSFSYHPSSFFSDMLLLYENEPQESLARTRIEAKLANSIRLKDAHITRQDFTFTVRTTDGQTYVLGSQSVRHLSKF